MTNSKRTIRTAKILISFFISERLHPPPRCKAGNSKLGGYLLLDEFNADWPPDLHLVSGRIQLARALIDVEHQHIVGILVGRQQIGPSWIDPEIPRGFALRGLVL